MSTLDRDDVEVSRKNRAASGARSSFTIEVLLIVAALIVVATILIVFFGRTQTLSSQARSTSAAVQLADDVVQIHHLSADDDDFVAQLEGSGLFDDVERLDDGTVEASRGDLAVSIELGSSKRAAGSLRRVDVSVGDGRAQLYTLSASTYASERGAS